ncbi:class I SAM-dependent methyltransferase [Flexivirga caeni]|uniref:Class I SAM-dependent methyltransferase n=1 Tax=Flexivirga caeni TaxID=2294115 RepID=A0A3M9M8G6_9MICO|nr:class I SAM-dependent methyltransferase [Flexivirga caeni]RNI21173.1 class I SAM-dependent methyltransferase [Flexivirga caeni]
MEGDEVSAPASAESSQDGLNRATWARTVLEFVTEGWADRGELAMLLDLSDEFRGRSILDIGVGAGRTVPLIRLMTRDYIALDYTAEMVQLCADRYPDVDVRHDDARTLSTVPDDSIELVMFSANGIDAVGHEDRQEVLNSVHRVLRPGGVFAFSTLNRDGAFFGATPADAPDTPWVPGSLRPRSTSIEQQQASDDDDLPWIRAVRNWRRLRSRTQDHGEWAIGPFAAHEFSLLVHFITLSGARRELAERGFVLEKIYQCDDAHPLVGASTNALYFHVVARVATIPA